MLLNHFDTQGLRHGMKDQRDIGTHARTPAKAQSRARCLQSFQKRARLIRWIMKCKSLAPRDDFYLRADLTEQRCNVEGGSSGTENGHLPAFKSGQIAVL